MKINDLIGSNHLNEKFLYVYFENIERDGNYLCKFFGKGVAKHAEFIKRKRKLSNPVVNHVGFLFFDNKWKIAELDYFQGGKVIKDLEDIGLENLHRFYISEIKELHIKKFYELFSDELSRTNCFCASWYSFRRYNFRNGLKLLNKSNSSIKHRSLLWVIIFFQLFIGKKSKHNCIDMVFEYCGQFGIKIWEKKKTPYELFDEINNK
ncbi:MAG: hypothetical protein ACJAZX_001288 [Rickettsiales bacterium]|jgi:hypothetical protein